MGRNSVKARVIEVDRVVYDTIIKTKIVHDTMWLERVVYRDMPVVVKEVDTVRVTDTVKVAIPMYNYRFKDDLYDISAEGYEVRLNSVTVYPRTEYKIERVETKNKWGLGIHMGYGVSEHGFSPYIGLGVSYNIFTW
jgi:hypothetical protein